MGPEGMKRRLYLLIEDLEAQAKEVRVQAAKQGVSPEQLLNRDGTYVMTPILLAQAHALAALQSLQASEKKR